MRNSIAYKTALAVSLTLSIVMISVGWIIYTNQIDIIDKLQHDEKQTILKYINNAEDEKLDLALTRLEDLSESLTNALTNALYNSDIETARNSVHDLLENDNIVAVSVYDSTVDEIFLIAKKENEKISFIPSLSNKIKKYQFFRFEMKEDDEMIGYFNVYYDNSNIIEDIKALKVKEISLFNQKVKEINKLIQDKLIIQIIIAIVAGIIVIILIIILLNKFVKKPLVEFQIGLNSFFEYLKMPSKKVHKIDIDTNDEFGQMTKSVNESIQVSMKMHGEMAQLMLAMDKNVITTETNDKGIITHVSEAFCKISGYSKEELLGKPHRVVRHPDMDKTVYDDLWSTIKAGKTWEGEVKNLKKDGGFYWVHAVISPKCTKAGASCGYTAIRYDITAQKAVEDLTTNLEIKIAHRTQDLENTKQEIEEIHKHTRDSIQYASLIQGALIPQKGSMIPFFKDHFVTWIPKDTVGGDIWLFNKMRHDDECLLYFIDCTGHGVPGAFVTMIVKAVEREITSIINSDEDMEVSPAWIMSYFNKTIKKLLRQESKDSLSNVGWDGGVIYYNRREQILKFAGAETPLFYTTADGTFNTIKGNRYSVGYKKCDSNYKYKETIIDVHEGMKFYCTTDGYLDQNGGEKDFPFGKKRFSNIIKKHNTKPMKELQEIFLNEMADYESAIANNDRNDDMTVIAFEIGAKSTHYISSIEEIVKYEGIMTQNVIASCMDNIEAKIVNMGTMGTISTITIEYCQNMMNYSKNDEIGSRQILPAGTIEVQLIDNKYYDIIAKNIVSIDDKNKIEPKLIEIKSLDKKSIKQRYRELRKSGANTHEKGGGIGMYEIAKVSDSIDYKFEMINKDKYYFTMISTLKSKELKEN